MRNKILLLVLPLALFLALFFRPLPVPAITPPPGPAVQIIPPPMERESPELEENAESSAEVHVIEGCTVTWYTEVSCGKDRQTNRAKTFLGVARAMAEQWSGPAQSGEIGGNDETD